MNGQARASALTFQTPVLDRRLTMLSAEEAAVHTPLDGYMSDTPTLANHIRTRQDSAQSHFRDGRSHHGRVISHEIESDSPGDHHHHHLHQQVSTDPRLSLHRGNSQMIQVRKTTQKTWTGFPRKGYRTTTKFFYEEIDGSWTAALIIVCFYCSGLVDSVTYQTYSVFTSLQTGNTILLALRLSDQPYSHGPFAYVKSLVSVASYCLGALFFNVLHRAPTELSNTLPPLKRWTLFTSFVIQAILLVVSVALAASSWVSTEPFVAGTFSSGSARNPDAHTNYLDLLPIGFLAFEAAGQVCLSRVLVINELPTIVVSTLYHDFMSEALTWRKAWRLKQSYWGFVVGQKRQIRRLLCIIALFAGAITGGFVYESRGGLAAALGIAAGVKIIMSVTWCLWKKRKVTETIVTEDDDGNEGEADEELEPESLPVAIAVTEPEPELEPKPEPQLESEKKAEPQPSS